MPMLLALTAVGNTVLSYFGIDWALFSYIGGTSLLPLAFLYLSSFVFRFCECHRMFLHYVAGNNAINIYDYHFTIPLDDLGLLCLHSVLACAALFMILYLHVKDGKKPAQGRG